MPAPRATIAITWPCTIQILVCEVRIEVDSKGPTVNGMDSTIEVVDDNLNELALFDDVRVCVVSVDERVRGIFACAKGGVQGWNFGGDVGDVVEGRSEHR